MPYSASGRLVRLAFAAIKQEGREPRRRLDLVPSTSLFAGFLVLVSDDLRQEGRVGGVAGVVVDRLPHQGRCRGQVGWGIRRLNFGEVSVNLRFSCRVSSPQRLLGYSLRQEPARLVQVAADLSLGGDMGCRAGQHVGLLCLVAGLPRVEGKRALEVGEVSRPHLCRLAG